LILWLKARIRLMIMSLSLMLMLRQIRLERLKMKRLLHKKKLSPRWWQRRGSRTLTTS